ncbi:hypothetical protein B7494_g2241 [Chlorociboria aeruginascens]|nr:hypothetical protein B7494_g2241 [Chlorociboria aeruginascens]
MSNPNLREGLNPLRPYYIPPTIGTNGPATGTTQGVGLKNGSAPSYASSAREIFSDIDISDYGSDGREGPVKIAMDIIKHLSESYMSTLLLQPLDVGRMVLQVKSNERGVTAPSASLTDGQRRRPDSGPHRGSIHGDYPSDDSDPDEPAYFTSSAPSPHSYSSASSRRRRSERAFSRSPSRTPSPRPSSLTYQLELKKPDSFWEVIGQEWTKEGAFGVWKGTTANVICNLTEQSLRRWTESFLSALLNVQDTTTILGNNILDSPTPWSSVGIVVAASVAAALLIAPLDLVRTKIILTSTSTSNRSFFSNVRSLPSYFCPPSLVVPTALNAAIMPLIGQSMSLLSRSFLGIDSVLTPNAHSVANFLSQTIRVFVRLPVETVLRRGQMAVVASPKYLQGRDLKPIVPIGPYKGVVGTMWSIVKEEGGSTTLDSKNVVLSVHKVKKAPLPHIKLLIPIPIPIAKEKKNLKLQKSHLNSKLRISTPQHTGHKKTARPPTAAAMHLMYTLSPSGKRIYTLKKVVDGNVTKSAHPARFSPDDKYSRHRVTLKKRYGLLMTQQKDLKVLGQ